MVLLRRTRDDYLHYTWGSGGIIVEGALRRRLAMITHGVDWDLAPRRLRSTMLAGLGNGALVIEEAAQDPQVADTARKYDIEPLLLVVGLMARKAKIHSNGAARIARRLLRAVPAGEQFTLAQHLGLVSFLDL